MMVLSQLNDEDEDDGAEDDDDDYLGSNVCQRCLMQRDQWGSCSAEEKPEGPRKTATQSHGFTLCVCVCIYERKGKSVWEFNGVIHSHPHHI